METILRDFLSGFNSRIKSAGGTTEIYYAFSTLYDDSKWPEQCYQNMLEIYSEAKELVAQLNAGDSAEDVWPTLDDLSFHAAIFGCYYHMFDFMLRKEIADRGAHWNDPSEITSKNPDSDLSQTLEECITLFVQLTEAISKKDIIAQLRYLNELYLATSQIQCIAARNRLGTKGN